MTRKESFKKEVANDRIKCWEVVENVAIRVHQRLLSEQVHLERCRDSSCLINLNVPTRRRQCHCWELEGCG